jgi:hypothetical protein
MAAAEWMREQQFGLGGHTPFDLLLSEPGSEEVESLLGHINTASSPGTPYQGNILFTQGCRHQGL